MTKLAAFLVTVGVAGLAWGEEPIEANATATPATVTEDLEAQAADAREKIEAVQPADTTPIVASESATTVTATAAEAPKPAKPFGLSLTLDHSFGTGNFIKNDYLRGDADSIVQSWDLTPSYKFKLFEHDLKASARVLFDVELTTPDSNPARRWTPYDVRLAVSDGALYKDVLTGINVSGGLRYFLPTSYESINVTKRRASVGASLGLDRSFGPIDLSWNISTSKNFNSTKVAVATQSLGRDSDPIRSEGSSGVVQLESGYANISFDLSNAVGVTWNVTDQLSLDYSLTFWQRWKYNTVAEVDEFTAPNADAGRARAADMLWPSLELGYAVGDAIKEVVELPFSLSMAAGMTALHPAQTDDNNGIIWPFFYQAFAQNRAANNYGSVYFDVKGTY